jgi:outer membrane protein assembly factor BamB/plastocyanin
MVYQLLARRISLQMTEKRSLSRRSLIAGAAAVPATALIASTLGGSNAQESPFEMPIASPEAIGPVLPPELVEFANDWPTPLGTLNGHRASLNSPIDSSNVATLGRQWSWPIEFGMTGTPIIAGETVYVQDMQSNVYALDRSTGELKWSTMYNIGTQGPNGPAIGYGMVYAALGDTCEVIALSMETGEEVWRAQISNNPVEGVLIAPTVYDNTVFVSTNPGNTVTGWYDGGGRGVFHALEASTGRTIWTWDTVVDNLWDNPRQNSGGGLWYPVTIDDDGNLYFGVGNAGAWPGTDEYPNGSSRPGNNLYASSMVSLDRDTGGVRWVVEAKPHDLFDLDFQNSPVLATVDVNGTERLLAIGSGKTGTVIAAEASSGAIIWKQSVGIHLNDELQVLNETPIEVYPAVLGGVETPKAYADGRVFLATVNYSFWFTSTGFSGGDSAPPSGQVIALDAATGEILWDVTVPSMPLGSVAVANDIVFHVGLDGLVRGFEAATGTQVWHYQILAGVNAPVSLAGDQLFVAAAGGFTPSPDQFADGVIPEQVNELIAFQLGIGGGVVPEATPVTGEIADEATPVATETGPVGEAATPSADANGALAITVNAFDLGYDLTNVVVPADTDITVTMNNTGGAVHNMQFDDLGIFSGDASGGQAVTFTFTAPAGVYTFYCTIPGHRAAGMVGTFTAE